jgi:hypothetical protein
MLTKKQPKGDATILIETHTHTKTHKNTHTQTNTQTHTHKYTVTKTYRTYALRPTHPLTLYDSIKAL